MKKLLFVTAVGAGFLLGCKKEDQSQHVECLGVLNDMTKPDSPITLEYYASFEISGDVIVSANILGVDVLGTGISELNREVSTYTHGEMSYKLSRVIRANNGGKDNKEWSLSSISCKLV